MVKEKKARKVKVKMIKKGGIKGREKRNTQQRGTIKEKDVMEKKQIKIKVKMLKKGEIKQEKRGTHTKEEGTVKAKEVKEKKHRTRER